MAILAFREIKSQSDSADFAAERSADSQAKLIAVGCVSKAIHSFGFMTFGDAFPLGGSHPSPAQFA